MPAPGLQMDYGFKYKSAVTELGLLFEHSKNVLSRISIRSDANWHDKAAIFVFHEAMSIAGVTLAFLPDTPYFSSVKSYTPLSVAGQTRVLLDTYLTISYLLEDKEPDMAALQGLVWEQQADYKRLEMLRQANPTHEKLTELEAEVKGRASLIVEHPLLESFDPEVRNNCAQGTGDGKVYRRSELVKRLGLEESSWWPMEKHCSQFIHATALAAQQLEALDSNPEGAMQFVYTLVQNHAAVFSMNVRGFHTGLGIELKLVPPGVYHTMQFWYDFFTGSYSEPEAPAA